MFSLHGETNSWCMQKSLNASKAVGLSSFPHLMFDPNLFFYKSVIKHQLCDAAVFDQATVQM